MNVLVQLGGFFVVILFTVGPVLALLLLLNLRDRRHARLLDVVWQLAPRDLSDHVAIQVRCAVFTRRAVVTVDMHACSRDEIWVAIARWSTGLPPKVRLLVNGRVDLGVAARFTLETNCRPLLGCPPRPSPVAG